MQALCFVFLSEPAFFLTKRKPDGKSIGFLEYNKV